MTSSGRNPASATVPRHKSQPFWNPRQICRQLFHAAFSPRFLEIISEAPVVSSVCWRLCILWILYVVTHTSAYIIWLCIRTLSLPYAAEAYDEVFICLFGKHRSTPQALLLPCLLLQTRRCHTLYTVIPCTHLTLSSKSLVILYFHVLSCLRVHVEFLTNLDSVSQVCQLFNDNLECKISIGHFWIFCKMPVSAPIPFSFS